MRQEDPLSEVELLSFANQVRELCAAMVHCCGGGQWQNTLYAAALHLCRP